VHFQRLGVNVPKEGATKLKVLIGAGGSGGHLIPAQQLAVQLLANPGTDVVFGGYKLTQSPYFKREQFPFVEIASSASLSRPGPLLKGVFQALKLIRREKPDVVVGFGSYHSAPILVAAALLRRKIFLYEANRTMGKVNRWIAPFAKQIGCQFPIPGCTNSKFVQVPMLPWGTSEAPKRILPTDARRSYGLDPDRFTLLVFGGSQGAAFLNGVMPKVANLLGPVQVIHCAGNETAAEAVRRAYTVPAVVKAFEADMSQAYSAADFVVCRSGAGTVAELIRNGAPALLIPYPYAAENHQQKNAQYLCELGGSISLDQADCSVDAIAHQIQNVDLEAMQLALRLASEQNDAFIQLYKRVLQL
jgi:UDP-N-acetylglucosamine--N-acetylmuramyl-(pentapeptide) pyrophosphoryl-undecaprenol N-acetylglucosamine transferase